MKYVCDERNKSRHGYVNLRRKQMRLAIRRVLPVLLAGCALCVTHAEAFDLNGAWAGDASMCKKIFVKKKSSVSIARNSDLYGSGFIVEGDKIRGEMAVCAIKSRKEDVGTLNLVAVCSADIALSNV